MNLVRRMGAFGLTTIINFGVGILSVPALIRFLGSDQWSAIVVAQSIAALAGVIVGFGWSVTGPSMIALTAAGERTLLLRDSLLARSTLFLVTVPVAIVVCIQIVDLPPLAGAFAVTAYLLQAMGAVWYFVGEGRPFRVLFLDTIPRSGGVVIGVIALALTGSVIIYTGCLLIAGLVSVVLSYSIALRGVHPWRGFRVRGVLDAMASQRHGVITAATATLYSSSPPILANIVDPAGLPTFALAYKLFTYLVNAVVPFLQAFQGWVPSAGESNIPNRARSAAQITIACSALAAVVVVFVLPVGGAVLAVGTVHIPYSLSVPIGVTVAAVLISQVVGLACLTAVGRSRVVAQATVVGSAVGFVIMAGLGWLMGVEGIAIGMAITEGAVACILLFALASYLRQKRVAAE